MNEPGLAQPRVSRVLVERYVAKIRKRRRWRRLAVTVSIALLVLVAALYYVGWHTGVLDTRKAAVRGTHVLTAAQVQATADVPLHVPMAGIDTKAVKARIMKLPRVASAVVERQWPHTILITIVERVPAAALPATDGSTAFTLVDADGVAFDTAPSADKIPAKVPTIEYRQAADTSSDDAKTARAAVIKGALAALKALPPAVRSRVTDIAATGPYGITMELTPSSPKAAKVTVIWGGGDQADLKARVLTILLQQPRIQSAKQPPTHYDVSAPGAPAYS